MAAAVVATVAFLGTLTVAYTTNRCAAWANRRDHARRQRLIQRLVAEHTELETDETERQQWRATVGLAPFDQERAA